MLKRLFSDPDRTLKYMMYCAVMLMLLVLLAIWHEGYQAVTSRGFWTR